jgi:phosphoadenosine phosphosulfate reductase
MPLEPASLLADAVERHHPRLVMLCSFQKEESVLVDELVRLAPDARVVTIDTGVLFPETLATWRAFEERFGVRVEVEEARGAWHEGNCCGDVKVAALERALSGVDAWITGIRREQSPSRAGARRVEWSERYGVWKIQPLVDWNAKRVQAYVQVNEIPYNPLHDAGYPSIGCIPCTRPVQSGEGERAGRWAGSDKLECGIHINAPLIKESND